MVRDVTGIGDANRACASTSTAHPNNPNNETNKTREKRMMKEGGGEVKE